MKVMKKIALAIAIFAVLAIGLSLVISRRGAMAGTSDATYVENKKCKACHIKKFKAQAETPHAMSFDNLKDAGEETNPECLPCHTTGYGKSGGFVDVASTKDLAGTTCQACHGPGSAHIEKGLSKEQRRSLIQKTPKDACTKCHKTHEAHPDIGNKALPSLKKKLGRVQSRIDELGG
jgi:hypothetical protein